MLSSSLVYKLSDCKVCEDVHWYKPGSAMVGTNKIPVRKVLTIILFMSRDSTTAGVDIQFIL